MQVAMGMQRTPLDRFVHGALALTLLLSFVPFVVTAPAIAADITVGAGEDLQAAIAAASPGDVLLLAPGEYVTSGQVIIDKPLTIVGAGINSTTLKNTANTTRQVDAYATTGWIYVQAGNSLTLSDLTLDGGSVEGKTLGAAVYAMGPLTADAIRVRNVKWSQYYGIGFILMGPGHLVSNCVFDPTVQRVGVHVDLAPTGGPAPDPAWDSIPYTATITGCTFTGAGAVTNCQYGVEAGRGGRARVIGSTLSGYRGVATSDGSPSGAILATSYYPTDGSKIAGISVEGCAISDSSYGVTVGFPYQLADTHASVTNTTFDGVDFDLDVQAPPSVVSVPTGSGNEALDGFFEYNWVGAGPTFDYLTNPPALSAGYYTLIAPTGSNLRAIIHAAADGDTILVAPGTFVTDGQVTIDKRLTIVGSGTGQTIVQNGVNTLGASMSTNATTGWFYVTSAGSLNISDMTFNGGALSGIKTGAAIYAMGPLTADNLHVTQVNYLPGKYMGVGIALMGSGHSVTNSVFDEIGRIGIYVGAAPPITVGDMDPSITFGAVVDGCTFTGNGAGDYCQYGMEIGRSGRAQVTNSDFSQYSGVASSDGSNSACLYVNSYWGVGTSKLVVDTCTFVNAEWGVVAGYPGIPPASYVPGDVPTDAILSVSRSTFNAVAHDVTADGDIQSTPTGIDNTAPDHDWLYERHDDSFSLVASPAPLAEGFINWFPVGVADAYDVQKDVTLDVPAAGVLANDTDANPSEVLTAALVDDVAYGTLTLNSDGSFSYVPAAGFTGADGFTYRASDWLDTSALTSVTLTVSNTAPVGVTDAYSVRQGQSLVVDAPGVLVNDSDANGDPITAALQSAAGNGAVLLHPNGSFAYVPQAGFAGVDSFTYVVDDGTDTSAPVTVTIAVVNSAPVAAPDSYDVAKNGLLLASAPGVLANDTDADSDPITAAALTSPTHGQVVLSWSGALVYQPDAGFVGTDSFTYRISDGVALSAPAVVTVNVTNTAPVAVDHSYSTPEDMALVTNAVGGVLAGASDANGDAISAAVVAGPAHGALGLDAGGAFTYTPTANWNGIDSFTYRVFDGDLYSAIRTVTITVSPVNDAPVAIADAYLVAHNTPLVVPARGVLGNGTDADGDVLTAELVTGAAKGTVTLNADGSFTYTPNPGTRDTTDSFSYRSRDAVAQSATTLVTLTIGSDTTAPTAPSLVASALGTTSIRLDWTPATDPSGIAAYRVYSGAGTLLATVAGTVTTYAATGLAAGTLYSFYVVAVDTPGNASVPSNTASATTTKLPTTLIPVYRFYSVRSGTHFYTPSAEEKDMVIATWPDVWGFEGIAYYVNPAKNTQPLHRFYNRNNGSHFYTASEEEANTVKTNYSNVFQYDGLSYSVTPVAETGKTPVYRFFNLKNGSHFYTASVEERDHVIATWPDVYRLEGPAFWLGQ